MQAMKRAHIPPHMMPLRYKWWWGVFGVHGERGLQANAHTAAPPSVANPLSHTE